jgi:AraC-like DNA-binding protein
MQIVPIDHLSALFSHFRPSARTFFSGNLCETVDFGEGGHLHLFKRGALRVERKGEAAIDLTQPAVLFFPRGRAHRFVADAAVGADLACAHVDLGDSVNNPIALGLPEFALVPLAESPTLERTCELLWSEAFAESDGKQAALDLLFDYFLILLVRHVISRGGVAGGVIAGLADPRLARALTSIHDDPGHLWTLEDLADVAGMSRTRFAAHFRAVIGRTAIDYLGGWRMTVAQGLLAQGRPVKAVSGKVGYDSMAAFTRAFGKHVGLSPRDWLASQSQRKRAVT